MGSSSRAGFQIGDTDSSESEQLPVIDFSQKRTIQKPSLLDLDSGSEAAPPVSCAVRPAVRDVHMISSDSEDEEVLVPLVLRLKQKQDAPTGATEPPNIKYNEEPPITAHHVPHELPQYSNGYPDPLNAGESNLQRRRRAPAEVEASKEEAPRRKAEREKQNGERERLKAKKKALTEALKAMRPEECLRHIVVMVDPGLLQLEGGGDLLTSLHAMGCGCAIEKQPLPRSVSWIRRTPSAQTGDVMSIPEAQTVIQVPVDDFISMVHGYIQEQKEGGGHDGGVSLTAWILRLIDRNPDRTLSLAVIDIEKYFKSQNSKSRQKFRDAVLGEDPQAGLKKRKRKRKEAEQLPEVSRVEMEEALVDLQLRAGVQVHFHSTWKAFVNYVTMSTKAVAEAPFKREREKTGFSFYLESEWAGGQKVDRTGKGLLQVWKRQIQQLKRVSADMASALLSAYPSPHLLTQAYRRCKSEREKVTLLSDLLIRRGEGVTSTTRRIGPELSKRIFLMMTSSEPEQTLDSTV